MKRYIVIFMVCFFLLNIQLVSANIMCNDGSESPTCSDCHQGCCSWHGGCASGSDESIDWGPVAVVGGGLAAGAYALGSRSKKKK